MIPEPAIGPDTDGLETVGCALGCTPGDDLVVVARDRLTGGPGEFRVVRCRNCGLMRTDPRPTIAAMAAYYPPDYEPYTTSRSAARRPLARLAGRMFPTNATRVPPLDPGRMLEIGCASGSFLTEMKAKGWRVQGLEPGPAADHARLAGHDVHAGTIAGMPEPTEPFDLIVGWMVLEHLHEPVGDLQLLRDWLQPHGRLVLSVPNAGSWQFAAFRDAWYSLHLPHHLWHFDPTTVRALLARAGWQVERILHQRNLADITLSLANRALDAGHRRLAAFLAGLPVNRGPARLAFFPLAWALAALGQTGRMTIIALPAPACADGEE